MKTILLGCLVILAYAGCANKQNETIIIADPTRLAGTWVLVDPASAYTVTLIISSQQALMAGFYAYQFTGRSSVNSYFADAQFSKGPSIESGAVGTGSVFALGATKMAGPPAAMQFETDYFARLGATDHVELTSDDKLNLHYTLTTPGDLVFKRQ